MSKAFDKNTGNPDLIKLVEHIRFSKTSAVVIREPSAKPQLLEALRDAIFKTYGLRVLVIGLPPGVGLEVLDEKEMLARGWARARERKNG